MQFESVEDGDTLPMIHGIQGGWHVWVAVQVNNPTMDAGSLTIELQPADESAPPQTTSLGVRFDPPDAEGGRSYLGWPAILADPSCSMGQLLHVSATLTTPAGETLSADRFIVPGPGDDPPPACSR